MPRLNINQLHNYNSEEEPKGSTKGRVRKKQQRDIYKKKNSKQNKEDDYRD